MDPMDLSRRQFLGATAAVSGLWLGGSGHHNQLVAAEAPMLKGKGALTVLSKTPLVMETPLEKLAAERITSKEWLFIRNNQDRQEAASLEPVSPAGWKIELTGLINRPAVLDAAKLAEWTQVEHELVLQCSGNSRSLYSKFSPTEGTQWGRGGFGNVKFRGVPLSTVLDKLEVKINPEAKFLTADGRDLPPAGKQDFEHSLRISDALENSFLALEMNGEPIPAIHGGPVRLITPGFFATMNIKWLASLRFEAKETTVNHQMPRYRMPLHPIALGEKYEFTFENSRPNWAMNVKSVTLLPAPESKVPAGLVKVQGVAFNDGAAKIDSVLVSLDGGQTWRPAMLEPGQGTYAWTRWSFNAMLPAGRHEILARASDALGRTQPLDGATFWNPHGYEWNAVEGIAIECV